MSRKSLFLALPEVSYLVEKIPIAHLALRPDAVTLRFLQHARESGMSLRDQCEAIGVPWHARKVRPEHCSKAVLRAARLLSPSVFGQTLPDCDTEPWAATIVAARRFGVRLAASLEWLAFHGPVPEGNWNDIFAALMEEAPPISTGYPAFAARLMSGRGIRGREATAWIVDDSHDLTVGLTVPVLRSIDRLREAAQLLGARRATSLPRPARESHPAAEIIPYPAQLLAPFCIARLGTLFTFRLLSRESEFEAEGLSLRHCLADRKMRSQFFSIALNGRCHIARLEVRGSHIATAEFSAAMELVQLRGYANEGILFRGVTAAAGDYSEHLAQMFSG